MGRRRSGRGASDAAEMPSYRKLDVNRLGDESQSDYARRLAANVHVRGMRRKVGSVLGTYLGRVSKHVASVHSNGDVKFSMEVQIELMGGDHGANIDLWTFTPVVKTRSTVDEKMTANACMNSDHFTRRDLGIEPLMIAHVGTGKRAHHVRMEVIENSRISVLSGEPRVSMTGTDTIVVLAPVPAANEPLLRRSSVLWIDSLDGEHIDQWNARKASGWFAIVPTRIVRSNRSL